MRENARQEQQTAARGVLIAHCTTCANILFFCFSLSLSLCVSGSLSMCMCVCVQTATAMLGRNGMGLFAYAQQTLRRTYIPLQRGCGPGVRRLTATQGPHGMPRKLVYGGSFTAVPIMQVAPFTLFWTWLGSMTLLFFFGAQPPDEYYLSMNRYIVYVVFVCLFCMCRGLHF